jgi:uncharacterized membrane protein YedE/YeeE
MISSATRSGLRLFAALVAGVLFGAGLAIAQMIDPRKVLAFLEFAGPWDASLLLVLGGAVLTAGVAFPWILRRPGPLWAERFHLPSAQQVDRPLLVGATIFGLGWGLAGYCPGPAIASLAYANPEALWFVPAMVAGAAWQRWRRRADAGAPAWLKARVQQR